MNRRINSILEGIQRVMEAEGDDITASGPSVPADVGGKSAADAEAGTGAAVNPSDVSDTLDAYLLNIADLLTLEYGKTDKEALSFVFQVAGKLAKEGLVPDVPSDSADEREIAAWLGKAKSVQFASQVLSLARSMLKA